MTMRLLVIDGNSIANRAFFGIKLLTTKDGRYTNAIYRLFEYPASPCSGSASPTRWPWPSI